MVVQNKALLVFTMNRKFQHATNMHFEQLVTG